MKEKIILGITILLVITCCGTISGYKQTLETRAATDTDKLYLELHFGKDDCYTAGKQEISYVYYPTGSTYIGSRPNQTTTKGSDLKKLSPYEWTNACAELPDGKIYSFSEAYDIQFNEQENTIQLFLWRNDPSALEMEEFSIERIHTIGK